MCDSLTFNTPVSPSHRTTILIVYILSEVLTRSRKYNSEIIAEKIATIIKALASILIAKLE